MISINKFIIIELIDIIHAFVFPMYREKKENKSLISVKKLTHFLIFDILLVYIIKFNYIYILLIYTKILIIFTYFLYILKI